MSQTREPKGRGGAWTEEQTREPKGRGGAWTEEQAREPKGAASPGLTSEDRARRDGGASRAPGGERDKQSAPEASGENTAPRRYK